MQGPGRRLRPLPGKIAPPVFCFTKPVWTAEPSVRMPVCRPRRSGEAGSGGQLPLRGCARKLQVCWKPGERVAFTSKAPALGLGLEQSPRLSCTHSPLTPGGKAAGDRGWGRLPELLHSSTCLKDRAVKGCLRRGLLLGLWNSQHRKGGQAGTGLLRAAVGPRPSPLWGDWTSLSCSVGWRSAGRIEFSETPGERF